MKQLTDKQMMRYSRQIMLPQWDLDSQEQVLNAKVLIIGLGGLGCAAAQYLAASGVGTLTLVDDDKVEYHNLQRQILHTEQDVNLAKVESAKQSIAQLNSEVTVEVHNKRLTGEALCELIQQQDVILDCCDNLATRNELNRHCYQHKKPLVSGAAIRMEGQVSCFTYQADDACYQCFSQLFNERELSCSEAGVLSPVVGIVGAIQATEALKLLGQIGSPMRNKLLMLDAATMSFNEFSLNKAPHCPVCS